MINFANEDLNNELKSQTEIKKLNQFYSDMEYAINLGNEWHIEQVNKDNQKL